jgi:hypothetical protein
MHWHHCYFELDVKEPLGTFEGSFVAAGFILVQNYRVRNTRRHTTKPHESGTFGTKCGTFVPSQAHSQPEMTSSCGSLAG